MSIYPLLLVLPRFFIPFFKMIKDFQSILHGILKIEITLLLFILYIFIVIPMSFVQKLNLLLVKTNSMSSWVDFKEKYRTLEDLKGEG